MADSSNRKRPGNAKPISLYPMTLEEAIRRAVNAPPLKDNKPKSKKVGSRKGASKPSRPKG